MMKFPDVVRIESVGLCNFKCSHCPIGREGGHRNILSLGNFLKFFDSLPHIPRVLVLYHGGEPLINKELEDMIAYAKFKGVERIVFNTNASLLHPGRDLSQVDEMRVSFDGLSAADNDSIRINGHFEKNAAAVKVLALSDERPRIIKIYNATTTGRVSQYLKDYFSGCDVVFEGVRIREWARTKNPAHPGNGATYCNDLFTTFTILSNGDVPMCCEDLQGDDIQGNVFQNSPAELWKKMQPRRDAFARGQYPKICQTCWVTRKDA